jgi:hypothetical protein
MIVLNWFRRKDDRYAFAVTPDDTGSVLPSPEEWQHWFSQPAHPEIAGSDLTAILEDSRQHGYYLYPRNGSMKPAARPVDLSAT